MKKSVLLALIVTSFNLFAASETKLLLTCEEKFSGLDKIEFFQARDGRIFGVQHGTSAHKSYTEEFKVDPIAFERKTDIVLTNWYGYERALSKTQYGWVIRFQDECGGGSNYTNCTEYK